MIGIFLVGPPGAGKTTLARKLIGQDPYLIQSPKWTVGERVCAAGHYTGDTFDGADTVPYNGVKAALSYWRHRILPIPALRASLFDGDRFSYMGALEIVREHTKGVLCVRLLLDEQSLEQRRQQRGSTQNASWMKGRATKAARFAEQFKEEERVDLDASWPPERLAEPLQQRLYL